MKKRLVDLLERYYKEKHNSKVVESMLAHLEYPLVVREDTSEWLLSQWWEEVEVAIIKAKWFLESGIEYKGTVYKSNILLAHDGECLYNSKLQIMKEEIDENTTTV